MDHDPVYRTLPLLQQCNTLVLSWLNHSVSPEIVTSIIWINGAKYLWQDLNSFVFYKFKVIFSISNKPIFLLQYFTKMKILWDELANFRPIPSCTRCCTTAKKVQEYRDHDDMLGFLQGLIENYAVVKSQILLMDSLPSSNKVISMISFCKKGS